MRDRRSEQPPSGTCPAHAYSECFAIRDEGGFFALFETTPRKKGRMMKTIGRVLWLIAAICLALCTLGVSLTAHAQTITVFNAPGAGAGPAKAHLHRYQPIGGDRRIRLRPEWCLHGFLRSRGGAVVTFDVPGAGTSPGQGTFMAAWCITRRERSQEIF